MNSMGESARISSKYDESCQAVGAFLRSFMEVGSRRGFIWGFIVVSFVVLLFRELVKFM